MLNRHFADEKSVGRITPANTLVIASSVSNGGGAALRAAEEDKHGRIDGVAVSEPNVNPKRDRSFTIQQGNGQPLVEHGRPLYDYMTFYTLYEGCAAATPVNTRASQVCTDLKAAGCSTRRTGARRRRLRQESAIRHPAGAERARRLLLVGQRLSGRGRRLCERLFQGQRDRQPLRLLLRLRRCDRQAGAVLPAANAAMAFAGSNGVPPTVGIQLIRNGVSTTTVGGVAAPMTDIDGAVCLRDLWTRR